ncbi:MAG: hypothetical protein K6E30_02250 [Lachnospiraceae bacterium]|nr:hypothetical protein [Lachnospiraceae bacterium]
MELLLEIIGEMLLEGCMAVFFDQKLPLPARISAAALLIVVYGGLIGACFYLAFQRRSGLIFFAGCLILLLTGLYAYKSVFRKKR